MPHLPFLTVAPQGIETEQMAVVSPVAILVVNLANYAVLGAAVPVVLAAVS